MDNQQLSNFIDLIASYIGLCLHDEDIKTLKKTIDERQKALNIQDPQYYYQMLKFSEPDTDNEWKQLIAALTTGESFFFRDAGQFEIIKNKILPDIMNQNKNFKTLRIWSAGCSTGEEPYSLAMLINDLHEQFARWSISIFGTDINDVALSKAKSGFFNDWSFRTKMPEIKAHYFTNHNGNWVISEAVRKMVTFNKLNLIKDPLPNLTKGLYNIDFIICRNVFIYFDYATVAKILRKFRDTLNDKGYLLTGHAELHNQDLSGFDSKIYPNSVVYQKTKPRTERCIRSEVKVRPEGMFVTSVKTKIFRPIKKGTDKKPPLRRLPLSKKTVSPHNEQNKHIDVQSGIEQAKVFLREGKFVEAINKAKLILEQLPENLDCNLILAKAYADMGRYGDAQQLCHILVEKHPLTVLPYYLLAQINVQDGDNEKAKDLYKKVIYIDENYVAAYIELAHIYDKSGDINKAKRLRASAADILKHRSATEIVEPYNEYTVGELLKLISNF